MFFQQIKSFNTPLKLFFLFTLSALMAHIPAWAQTTDTASVKTALKAAGEKLAAPLIKAEEKEKLFLQMASLTHQLAEVYFSLGLYEKATGLFVEADGYTRQYHQHYFSRSKVSVEEEEKKLVAYTGEKNEMKRGVLLKAGRIVVSAMLSEVIREARYLEDNEAEKKYLTRLAVLSQEAQYPKDEADAYEKLGQLALNNDRVDESFALYQKALALRKPSRTEWNSLDYIAYAHWQTGDYEKALSFFDQEIKLLRELERQSLDTALKLPDGVQFSGPELTDMRQRQVLIAVMGRTTLRSSLASALFNTAQIKMLQGNYGAAAAAVNEVQAFIDSLKEEKEAATDDLIRSLLTLSIASHQATTLRIRGRILEARGSEEEALKNYTEAVSLFSQLSGGEPSGAVATLRGRMALLFSNQQKWTEARANINEVMRLRARLHQQQGTVFALMFASRIELSAKEMNAALKYARQAKAAALPLSYADDLVAEASETEADVLVEKAPDKSSLSLEQAILSYRAAIEVYRKADLRPLLARALSSLGVAYERAERWKEAEASYKEAVQVKESISAGFSSAQEGDAFLKMKESKQLYQRLVDLLIRQGKTETALQYASKAQQQSLVDLIPKTGIRLQGKAADQLKAVQKAEGHLQMVRSNLDKARTETTTGKQKNMLISSLGSARQEYAVAIKRLETEQPNLRFTVRPTDLLKLQSTIAPTEAIVSYLLTVDKLFVFVVRKNNVAVRTIEATQAGVRAMVAQAREGIAAFSKDFYALSFDAETGFAEEKGRPDLRKDDGSAFYKSTLAPMQASLTALHQTLITPIEDLLTNTATLKIIPNGELFLLPFSALLSPKDGKYLVERFDLVFFTAGDLIQSAARPARGNLVAFGNPTEADLEGALEEVKAIQSVVQGAKIYTENAATKDQLFRVKAASVLHLATHGHILSPLENSNIQLAHLPNLDQPDLSYGEIYALPFEALDMVVLSACQTALGTVSGTEIGVFIEAFRTKASSVAASLWSVDDLSTRVLMTEFYKQLLAGKTRSAALRSAQLKVLGDSRLKNPFFWAAFVLYGDGSKLTGLRPSLLKQKAN